MQYKVLHIHRQHSVHVQYDCYSSPQNKSHEVYMLHFCCKLVSLSKSPPVIPRESVYTCTCTHVHVHVYI